MTFYLSQLTDLSLSVLGCLTLKLALIYHRKEELVFGGLASGDRGESTCPVQLYHFQGPGMTSDFFFLNILCVWVFCLACMFVYHVFTWCQKKELDPLRLELLMVVS